MDYMIRDMRESDWENVARIYTQGIESGNATYEPTCPSWEQFDAAHHTDCRFVVVKDESEGAIGWATIKPISPRAVFQGVAEVSIYIDQDYKGQGLGFDLLMHLAQRSQESGYWTLQSHIFPGNIASLRIHEKCGFRLVGTREKLGQDKDGKWRDICLLERRSGIM
ncbi:MAG: N-acetyltransferase family protein [Eubacteriaceae bacterium]|nr:N-acetyltransferase family protein [Eubacteriaceae bacterium]